MSFVILLVTSLVAGVTQAQFTPGCSFSAGQCMYNVQLGHQGQCDVARAVTSSGDCCAALQGQVTSLTGDVDTLKSQMATLISDLLETKDNLSSTADQLTTAQLQTQQLLQTLAQKEAELNTTQADLSRVLSQAGDEIRNLRDTVQRLTSELNTCKGTLGLATNTSTFNTGSSILPTDVSVLYCDFETVLGHDATCGFTNQSYGFVRGSGEVDRSTGPKEDHTMGSPHGHYMYMDAHKIAVGTTSSSEHKAGLASAQLPPGPGYCIRFWYNMYGSDVKDLNVYAKVASGNGYPIFTHHGNAGQVWSLAEVDLDREYTSHPFQLVIEATTNAYRHPSYGTLMYADADIAIDDLYVYNTSCKNVPLCPSNGVTRDQGTTTFCYTFHTQPMTWYEAASLCRQQGATTSLVTITSPQEQDFIVQTIKGDVALSAAGQYGYYAGGNDERLEHTFDWTDSGVPYQGTYTDWKTGQPNNVANDQDCLLLQYPDLDYQWGDVDCDERHPFICKTSYPKAAASTHGVLVG